MRKLKPTELTEIVVNHKRSEKRTLDTTIFKAYNRGQIDGVKDFIQMQLQDLDKSFSHRETFDDAIADVYDNDHIQELEKSHLEEWLNERLDGTKLNKEDFTRVINDEFNQKIMQTVSTRKYNEFENFLKYDGIGVE